MSFRKEKKFKLNTNEFSFLKFKLLQNGMSELYPKRTIKSCYFDNQNLRMFHDSEEGILPRKKIRLRWYGDLKELNKEIKVTSIEGRFKKVNKIKIDNLEDLKSYKIFDCEYGFLRPILIIKYEREYFSYKNLRLTFDMNISYENILSITNPIILDPKNVMEIKTSINTSEDYLSEFIPIQSSRFSKYARGILSFQK